MYGYRGYRGIYGIFGVFLPYGNRGTVTVTVKYRGYGILRLP